MRSAGDSWNPEFAGRDRGLLPKVIPGSNLIVRHREPPLVSTYDVDSCALKIAGNIIRCPRRLGVRIFDSAGEGMEEGGVVISHTGEVQNQARVVVASECPTDGSASELSSKKPPSSKQDIPDERCLEMMQSWALVVRPRTEA